MFPLLKGKTFKFDIDKDGTAFLKALAIFIVVSHNYWRNVLPAIGENEMLFSVRHVSNAINAVMMRPSEFLNPFFSLFGHYGVHLFIFLSAYGLTKKLSNAHDYRGEGTS